MLVFVVVVLCACVCVLLNSPLSLLEGEYHQIRNFVLQSWKKHEDLLIRRRCSRKEDIVSIPSFLFSFLAVQ